jgi:hypothetical protein
MAQNPDSLAFRFAVVLALVVIVLAVTSWGGPEPCERYGRASQRADLPGSTFEFVLNGRPTHAATPIFARAKFSVIGKQSAAILNSSGKVACMSAANVVAVARRKSSFLSSAR